MEICTIRAPHFLAISWEPSVEPLSPTTISPEMSERSKNDRALVMQVSRVSASFKHGITMVSSTDMKASHGTLQSVPSADLKCRLPMPVVICHVARSARCSIGGIGDYIIPHAAGL